MERIIDCSGFPDTTYLVAEGEGASMTSTWKRPNQIANPQLIAQYWKAKNDVEIGIQAKLSKRLKFRTPVEILQMKEKNHKFFFLTIFEGLQIPFVVPYHTLVNMHPSLVANYLEKRLSGNSFFKPFKPVESRGNEEKTIYRYCDEMLKANEYLHYNVSVAIPSIVTNIETIDEPNPTLNAKCQSNAEAAQTRVDETQPILKETSTTETSLDVAQKSPRAKGEASLKANIKVPIINEIMPRSIEEISPSNKVAPTQNEDTSALIEESQNNTKEGPASNEKMPVSNEEHHASIEKIPSIKENDLSFIGKQPTKVSRIPTINEEDQITPDGLKTTNPLPIKKKKTESHSEFQREESVAEKPTDLEWLEEDSPPMKPRTTKLQKVKHEPFLDSESTDSQSFEDKRETNEIVIDDKSTDTQSVEEVTKTILPHKEAPFNKKQQDKNSPKKAHALEKPPKIKQIPIDLTDNKRIELRKELQSNHKHKFNDDTIIQPKHVSQMIKNKEKTKKSTPIFVDATPTTSDSSHDQLSDSSSDSEYSCRINH